MKRLFANLAMASVFSFCAIVAVAQDTVSLVPSQVEGIAADSPESGAAGLLQTMEERFVEGNVFFMSLICLILLAGLILSIERVIFLNLSNVNAKKLLSRLEDALEKGDIEGARNICSNTRGPVAAVCYQGRSRIDESPDVVEHTANIYAKIQINRLKKGCSWIALLFKIALMLGFIGMVGGLVVALDAVQESGEATLMIMAGGIKMALITLASGLVVYLLLKILYSFIQAKIENLSNQVKDAFITLFDMIMKYNLKYKK